MVSPADKFWENRVFWTNRFSTTFWITLHLFNLLMFGSAKTSIYRQKVDLRWSAKFNQFI